MISSTILQLRFGFLLLDNYFGPIPDVFNAYLPTLEPWSYVSLIRFTVQLTIL